MHCARATGAAGRGLLLGWGLQQRPELSVGDTACIYTHTHTASGEFGLILSAHSASSLAQGERGESPVESRGSHASGGPDRGHCLHSDVSELLSPDLCASLVLILCAPAAATCADRQCSPCPPPFPCGSVFSAVISLAINQPSAVMQPLPA